MINQIISVFYAMWMSQEINRYKVNYDKEWTNRYPEIKLKSNQYGISISAYTKMYIYESPRGNAGI